MLVAYRQPAQIGDWDLTGVELGSQRLPQSEMRPIAIDHPDGVASLRAHENGVAASGPVYGHLMHALDIFDFEGRLGRRQPRAPSGFESSVRRRQPFRDRCIR